MLAAAHATGEARCGHAFNTVTTVTEPKLAHHQQTQSTAGLGRPIITLPPPAAPSQPALAHDKAAEQQQHGAPLSGVPAQHLLLPCLPAGPSAASSPATPPAVEGPLSPTASPPSVSHTHAAAAAAAPAPDPPAPQQRTAAAAATTTAPAAAASAAAAALSSTKRRLEGSLLLSQLLPLSASLSVALAAGDVSRMHAVLTLLQSLPVTGQLLWASQVAKPVRGVLQQQAQLRTAQLQQAQQLQQTQTQQQTHQQQQAGLLEDVLSTARGLLRRWKALLAAEMAACDEYRTLRAQQLLRARKQKLQRAKSGGAAAAAPAAADNAAAQQCSSEQRGTPTAQRKRTYSEWLQEQQQQQQQGQQVAPDGAACPPRPPLSLNKQQRASHVLPPNPQQHTQAQAASAGSSFGRVSSGPGLGLLGPSSSNFSLAAGPDSAAVDLPDLAGMEWEDAPLPEFGAAAAAAADAAIGAGGVSAGTGGVEGSWGVGEEEGELLVDRPAPLQGQGQDAAAFML